jgi:hypothetical protein
VDVGEEGMKRVVKENGKEGSNREGIMSISVK